MYVSFLIENILANYASASCCACYGPLCATPDQFLASPGRSAIQRFKHGLSTVHSTASGDNLG